MADIYLHGDCLVGRASELHKVFVHHLTAGRESVEIDMTGAGRCDLSFFQLICAASRAFSASRKQMTLSAPLPPSLIRQFEAAGFGPACAACDHGECVMKTAAGPSVPDKDREESRT